MTEIPEHVQPLLNAVASSLLKTQTLLLQAMQDDGLTYTKLPPHMKEFMDELLVAHACTVYASLNGGEDVESNSEAMRAYLMKKVTAC